MKSPPLWATKRPLQDELCVYHRKQLFETVVAQWVSKLLQKWRMTANLWTIKTIWKFLATQTGRILLYINAVTRENFVTLEWQLLLILQCFVTVYCLTRASVLVNSAAPQWFNSSEWSCWRVYLHPARASGSSRPKQPRFWTGKDWDLELCSWLRRECLCMF